MLVYTVGAVNILILKIEKSICIAVIYLILVLPPDYTVIIIHILSYKYQRWAHVPEVSRCFPLPCQFRKAKRIFTLERRNAELEGKIEVYADMRVAKEFQERTPISDK